MYEVNYHLLLHLQCPHSGLPQGFKWDGGITPVGRCSDRYGVKIKVVSDHFKNIIISIVIILGCFNCFLAVAASRIVS